MKMKPQRKGTDTALVDASLRAFPPPVDQHGIMTRLQ